ncbi:phosphatase PAP2 family protein [Friedmanniella luteola]|nr:phosphatase PAP2 family protein [Friedmanniella luteola]
MTGAGAGAAHADESRRGDGHRRDRGVEPTAGTWKTWVLSSGTEIPVKPPPRGQAARRDLDAVLRAAAARTDETLEQISFWDTGSPGFRWNQIGAQLLVANPAPDTFRVVTYLNLAIYDATIAAWAWKQHYRRQRPSGERLRTAVDTPRSPSYPSEHGAAAGAAVGVLSHFYPDQAAALAERAAEHAASRVAAGVEHPSDFKAGYALGRAVGAKVARARIDGDGFDKPYRGDPDVPYPGGDGSYPVLPKDEGYIQLVIGEWKPLLIGDVTAFRSPPPPAKGSAERAAEVAEVKNYPRRKQADFAELFFWAQDPAGRPEPDSGAFVNAAQAAFYYAVDVAFIVLEDINQKIHEYKLDANPPRAARTYALTFAAMLDAYIACWNAKYHYLVGRPIHFDPTIDTLWTTYPVAAYPSGHSCNLTAPATVLGYLFPRDAHYFLSRAKENAASRLWAGIHFRSDFEAGVAMGQEVGRAVIEHAKADGSS